MRRVYPCMRSPHVRTHPYCGGLVLSVESSYLTAYPYSLVCIFPSPPASVLLLWQHERSGQGDAADYPSVSSAQAHWASEQRTAEGLRSRDLNKPQWGSRSVWTGCQKNGCQVQPGQGEHVGETLCT